MALAALPALEVLAALVLAPGTGVSSWRELEHTMKSATPPQILPLCCTGLSNYPSKFEIFLRYVIACLRYVIAWLYSSSMELECWKSLRPLQHLPVEKTWKTSS